jgi:16S rRNA G527 N7-methylase RsmG
MFFNAYFHGTNGAQIISFIFESKRCFGQITSRAFAETYKTLKLTQHLLCDNGHYLLMKGTSSSGDSST